MLPYHGKEAAVSVFLVSLVLIVVVFVALVVGAIVGISALVQRRKRRV